MGFHRFCARIFNAIVLPFLAIVISVPVVSADDRCPGDSLPILRASGGFAPYVALTAGERSGSFLLDFGSTQSSLSRAQFVDRGPSTVTAFSLPTFASGRFVILGYHDGGQDLPGGQIGIVGTDFLSRLTVDFSFRADGRGDVVIGSGPCAPDSLRRRGLVAVSQGGRFSSEITRVRADQPNVPVLPLRLGSVTVQAQIDTGYDDRVYPPSVDINEALHQRLVADGVVLQRVGTVRVSTCDGSEVREVYRAPNLATAIVGSDGSVIRTLAGLTLLRKGPGMCGGIGNMTDPAAQLGASMLWQLGEIVLDPKAETVWVRPEAHRGGMK